MAGSTIARLFKIKTSSVFSLRNRYTKVQKKKKKKKKEYNHTIDQILLKPGGILGAPVSVL